MLPKNLKYGTKIESAVARSSRINIAPQNGTGGSGPVTAGGVTVGGYNLGDTIIFNIPTRDNLVLVPTESYLKFNINVKSNKAGNIFRWDSCGAHGIIQRVRIFSGANLVQDIDNYGLLAKMLYDLQMPTDATYGKMTMLAGTRTDLVSIPNVPAVPADLTASATNVNALRLSAYQVNSGERIGGDRTAVTASGSFVNETYCLNLISLVGSLCSSQYLPLFAMKSAPLRVEITLVDSFIKGCSDLTSTTLAETASIQIANCEYVANLIELGDSAMSVIYGSLEGAPLQFVVPDFRNYQFTSTLTNGVTTQVNFPIPAKFSSLKSLLVTCRDKGQGATTGYFPFSSVTNGILDYQFRLGAQILPPRPPSTLAEMYSEALKAMGSIADTQYTPSIDKRSYSIASSSASDETATNVSSVSSGSFYIGIDLENYSSADKSALFAGYNSNNDDAYLIANFAVPGGAPVVCRFDAFANFDCVVVCENDTCYVKY